MEAVGSFGLTGYVVLLICLGNAAIAIFAALMYFGKRLSCSWPVWPVVIGIVIIALIQLIEGVAFLIGANANESNVIGILLIVMTFIVLFFFLMLARKAADPDSRGAMTMLAGGLITVTGMLLETGARILLVPEGGGEIEEIFELIQHFVVLAGLTLIMAGVLQHAKFPEKSPPDVQQLERRL